MQYRHPADDARHRYFPIGSNSVGPSIISTVRNIVRLQRRTGEASLGTGEQLEEVPNLQLSSDIGAAQCGTAEGDRAAGRSELAAVRRTSAVQVWPVDTIDRGIAGNGERSHRESGLQQ